MRQDRNQSSPHQPSANEHREALLKLLRLLAERVVRKLKERQADNEREGCHDK